MPRWMNGLQRILINRIEWGIAMSVMEETLNLMTTMTEEEQLGLYYLARRIIDQRDSPFRPISKKQILADLAISRKQIEDGEVIDFDLAMDEIEAQNDMEQCENPPRWLGILTHRFHGIATDFDDPLPEFKEYME